MARDLRFHGQFKGCSRAKMHQNCRQVGGGEVIYWMFNRYSPNYSNLTWGTKEAMSPMCLADQQTGLPSEAIRQQQSSLYSHRLVNISTQ